MRALPATHSLYLNVATNTERSWRIVYDMLSETARELSGEATYWSVGSSLIEAEVNIKDETEMAIDVMDALIREGYTPAQSRKIVAVITEANYRFREKD